MRDQDNPGRRRAEQQAIRRGEVTGGYDRTMGKNLMDYVSDPNVATKRNFARLITDRLRSENSALRVEAMMALMSAFELMLEDRVNFVMDETRQSRLDSLRIT